MHLHQLDDRMTALCQRHTAVDGVACVGRIVKTRKGIAVVDVNKSLAIQVGKDHAVLLTAKLRSLQIDGGHIIRFPGNGQEGDLHQLLQDGNLLGRQTQISAAATAAAAATVTAAATAGIAITHNITSF